MRLKRHIHQSGLAAMLACALGLSACAGGPAGPSSAPSAALPLIVAHRGGTGDAPENTLEAIRLALAQRADAMWLTVQLSKDGVPVLYRPADLSALTPASGAVADRTAAELARLNAGWNYKDADGQYPYRVRPVGIPTLRDALRALPAGMPVVLDMKALPAPPQAAAVARVLDDLAAWPRVMLYSTEAAYQQAFAAYPQARLFESRDATRDRLVKVLLGQGCESAPAAPVWTGFELHRPLTVTEKFTLGEGVSRATATLWNPTTVACFRRQAPVRILAIAVNDAAGYRAAACLGLDAVLADSPRRMTQIRASLAGQPLRCDAPDRDVAATH
ncbi:glycerophosphodiester phosphodiesterase family protein [Burkholderia alba]|uniref:glycerophosphodiester phosphodiesterase family protein n=1 Tax=Burkholderia alba TaxID=2683677 RepID=UPI002B053E99|nr:glycerophosphodiester phosphodiesterase family protein [Burkholderia alba]